MHLRNTGDFLSQGMEVKIPGTSRNLEFSNSKILLPRASGLWDAPSADADNLGFSRASTHRRS